MDVPALSAWFRYSRRNDGIPVRDSTKDDLKLYLTVFFASATVAPLADF